MDVVEREAYSAFTTPEVCVLLKICKDGFLSVSSEMPC